MSSYLTYQFEDTTAFVSTFDELPLWSAPFGLLLLKQLELKRNMTVVDAGCGAGFPLLELAERLGSSCRLYGIDTWKNALERARRKITAYGVGNAEIIECSAAQMPFEEGSIDLIVSNLGINNFEAPEVVFQECCRVLKPGGKLALTTNLNGHWQGFYDIFEQTLKALGKDGLIEKLQAQQQHRGSVASISKLFTTCGFVVTRHVEECFEMNFLDGTAFLNHHFVKLGWLGSWKALLLEEDLATIFSALEEALNHHAATTGMLRLTVPMAFIEGRK